MAWDSASFPWDWDADTLLVPDHQSCGELRRLAASSRSHDAELSIVRNGTPTCGGRDMCPAVLKTGSTLSMTHARWEGAEHIDVGMGSDMANTYGMLPGSASVGQGTDSYMEPEKVSIPTCCIRNGSFSGCGNNAGVQSLQVPSMVHSEQHQTNFFGQKSEVCSTKVKTENDALERAKAAYMDEQHSSNATGSAGSGDSLTGLQLGKRTYPLDTTRVTSKAAQKPVTATKKTRTTVAVPRCQVEGCKLDLSAAKDYHRRHKVCETHSKTEKVIVASMEQRFCQQCSRFHLLAEFDEAKRSCRRRLAGHNKRRRKPQPDPFALHARMQSAYEDWSFFHQQKFSGMSLLWQDPDGFRSGGMWPCTTSLGEDQLAYDYAMQGLAMGRPGHTNGLLPQQCDDKLSLLLLQSPKALMPKNVHPRVQRWPLGTLGSPMGDTLTLAPASVGGGVRPGLDVTTLVTHAVTRVSDSGRALSLLSMQPWSSHAPGIVKLETPGLATMDHLQPMMHEEAVHHQPFLMQAGSMVTFEKDVDCSYAPDLNRQASSYPLFTPMAYHQEDGLSGARPA